MIWTPPSKVLISGDIEAFRLSIELFVPIPFCSVLDFAYGAPIDEALKTLKGLSAKDRLTRIENEARKEGSVRWASSTPQPWAEPALQIFRKRYPTIQVEYMRQSGRVLAERIIREHRAGKYDIDIVGTSAVTFAGMKDSGVIAPYVSPEAAQLRQNMKTRQVGGLPISEHSSDYLQQNAGKKSPRRLERLSDPKWQGEFSIDDTRYEWFYALQQIYGRQEASKMITGFSQNGVNLRRGGTLRAQLVGAGEESCGLGVYLNNVRDLLEQNAPVTYSVPEPVIVVPVINMMAKLPPHPYAAILLYDFILTPEATGQYTRANAMAPARDNLPLVKGSWNCKANVPMLWMSRHPAAITRRLSRSTACC